MAASRDSQQHSQAEVGPAGVYPTRTDRPSASLRGGERRFAKEEGTIVLKPLQGSGGASVFLVRPDDVANINQMIDAVSRDGFVIAQEYLPAAERGDMRLFMMNGRPLRVKGKYAAFRRRREGGDMRSNIHAGGKLGPAEVTDEALRIAEIVRPKLVQDGMFLVGLDIVGDADRRERHLFQRQYELTGGSTGYGEPFGH